ncbi:hypothetical protein [Sporosarcina sp. Te-1]|uniref:hypothetical protein n=1 Tax=Sporosarcina sp. Te-1 TaxID=2818390 RepID=UPI001A9CDB73|nr:hypothetical protein [Sporosarcina sp. Te-1]QTD40352.1 hypothetical protein J3U78_16430 [Sporosarcina sp. Te-1]
MPSTGGRNFKKGYDHIREKVTDQEVIDHIKQEKENHAESKGRYDAPKIHQFLKKEGFHVSLKTYPAHQESRGNPIYYHEEIPSIFIGGQIEERDNLLEWDFETTTINEKWVADITYVYTIKSKECSKSCEFCICSSMIDHYNYHL